MKAGCKNGKGKYSWTNGAIYEGIWENDQAHGEGIFTING